MPLRKESYLPLYRGGRWHRDGEIVAPTPGQHFGLVWERYFDGYTEHFDQFLKIEEKTDRLTKEVTRLAQHGKTDFVQGFAQSVGVASADLVARQRERVAALDGKTAVYQIDWRFATGLGNEHPTENGFAWHRTLGTPYLPGSSVKGLLRGYVEWLCGVVPDALPAAETQAWLIHWFGSPHKDPGQWLEGTDSRAGWYIFFDALPTVPVELAADVMTPHLGGWYENGGSIGLVNGQPDPAAVPADWHSPVPVVFLVAKQGSFQFSVAVREGLPREERQAALDELDEVMAYLKQALEWLGAGAKTAAGYGRMSPDDKANKHFAKLSWEAGQQKMSPRERLAAQLAEWPELELARRFGVDFADTKKQFGADVDLLLELARGLRKDDIDGWQNATKKTDKARWKAYRRLTGQAADAD